MEEINSRLYTILQDAFRRAVSRSRRDGLDMRISALIAGIERVTQGKLLRGLFP